MSDKTKREELDAVINQARVVLLKTVNLPTTTRDDDPKLKNLNPKLNYLTYVHNSHINWKNFTGTWI